MSVVPVLPPEELRLKALKALVENGIEATPENLVQASRKRGAPLYKYFRELPDEQLLEYARYEICRSIIRNTKVDLEIGGKTISVRYVECVKVDGHKRYATVEDIAKDSGLLDAYMREIESLNEQAVNKMQRLRMLMAG